jgi:PilZ domain
MHQERRRTRRHPFGRVAAIILGQDQEHPCLVKDYSDGGVRLQPNGFDVPDDFELLFSPTEPARSGRYKVVWRLGSDVGAKFVGPASFPDGHDGPP